MSKIKFSKEVSYIEPDYPKFHELTKKEKDLISAFMIDDLDTQQDFVSILRFCNKNPGTLLHFFEKIFDKHAPWILCNIDLFWDHCKFHKYIYDDKGDCHNIFKYYDSIYYEPYRKSSSFLELRNDKYAFGEL